MVIKKVKGLLSFLIVFLMVSGMAVTGKITLNVNAAGSTFKVQIADVERYYTESKKILDMINEYRAEKNKENIVMDKDHLEAAMVRAAELSLFASDVCPNGQNGTVRIPSSSGGGQIIAYDVRSLYAMMTTFKEDNDSNGILLSTYYKSIGIGVVKVNGYKFVCILASSKAPSPVSDNQMNQITELDQTISVLPEVISEMSPAYSDESGVAVGSSIPACVIVQNKNYPSVNVYLTSYNATVNFSAPDIFELNNGDLVAVNPGLCSVRISYPGGSQLGVSVVLKSIGKTFGSCKFPTIPDQNYTGNAIRPNVVITDSTGARLVNDKDYKLTYKNNVSIGTASIVVTGLGQYGGQEKTLYFRIVSGGDDPTKVFSISVTTSVAELLVGGSVTINAHTNGGVSPYSFTYQYAPYGTSSWETLKSASSSTSYIFKPSKAGNYYLRVQAVDGNKSAASQSVILRVYSAMTLDASLSTKTAAINDVVKITASANGGKAPLQYAYYLLKPSDKNWTTIKGFSDSQTAKFKPTSAGKYKVCVKLKGAVGEVVKKYIELNVYEVLLKNTSQISSKEIDLGQTVTMKGSSENGKDVNYAYLYKKSSEENWRTLKNYSTATSAVFKPSAAGTYDLCIKAKDATGFISKNYYTLKVHKELVNTSKMSAGVIYFGQTVTFTLSAANGSGSFKYAVYLKKGTDASYKLLSDYSTNTSYTYNPDAKGNYSFKVKVKDSVNSVVTKDFSLKVQVPLSMTAKASASSIKSGQSVTITSSSSGGTSPYQMAIYYMKPGESKFIKVSDYESSNSRTLKLSTKGSFTIRVKVKDSASNIASKDLTVTVE